ncbi:MAG: AAA family ATPase [Actinomycetota bacterium]|nr:AAA family ATPase [Actinomycetota bacterium]
MKAISFGPFIGESLELAPGMNVIYGPNESGKSSWHAAIYAAVCGIKRSRGQPAREDRRFADRHRPWLGRSWRVSAVVALDDGRVVNIEQSFGSGGRSVATDGRTGRPVTIDIVRAGSIDASTLLGLTRETALATLFVRQADMLRVLTDADSLQEYLERAAATSAVDTTADEALSRIDAYKRDRVGVLRVGARGPLAAATRRFKEAQDALDAAEGRFEGYQQLLARHQAAERELETAELRLHEVAVHEEERERRRRWTEIEATRRRLEQARQLARGIASGERDPASKEILVEASKALMTYEARPQEPAPLEGPTSEELVGYLVEIPDGPEGDLEPAVQVRTLREAQQEAAQRFVAHDGNPPEPTDPEDWAGAGESGSIEIEAELAALPDVPRGDLDPAPEVTAHREGWHRLAQTLAGHAASAPTSGTELLPADSGQTAAEMQAELDGLPPAPTEPVEPAADVMRSRDAWWSASQALATHGGEPAELGGPRPPVLEGSTSAEIEAQLAALPDAPVGGIEPDREVTGNRDHWMALRQRLDHHEESRPRHGDSESTLLAPTELRRLADELDAPMPMVDPELRREVHERRAEAERLVALRSAGKGAGDGNRAVSVLGIVLALAGIGVLVLGQIPGGVGVIALGVILAVLTRRSTTRRRAGRLASPPTAEADVDLRRLEARLLVEEEATAREAERRESATARAVELGLPGDPTELRRLAREHEDWAAERARLAQWERRRGELEAVVAEAEQSLRAALVAQGTPAATGTTLREAFGRYVEDCRRRAQQAAQAARRDDLEARLRERRAAEAAHESDRRARVKAAERLLAVASSIGLPGESDPDLVMQTLRDWLTAQERLEVARQRRAQGAARLDQLLDGRTLEQLEDDIRALVAEAGDPPPDGAPDLENRSAEIEGLDLHVRRCRDALAEIAGHIEGAEEHLVEMGRAIEAEARAAEEVERLEQLSEDLDVASTILRASQEKVHADIAPLLNETIRPWVRRITGGRYDDIKVDPATLEVHAHERGGEFRRGSLLSHGTTEQLFLLLRLALAERLATTGERAPLVLDDITVQSDADRTVAVLDLLHELSADHQVILFSQEEEVVRWAQAAMEPPRDKLLQLEPRS